MENEINEPAVQNVEVPDTPPPESPPATEEAEETTNADLSDDDADAKSPSVIDNNDQIDSPMEQESAADEEKDNSDDVKSDRKLSLDNTSRDSQQGEKSDSAELDIEPIQEPTVAIDENSEDSKEVNDGGSDVSSIKRPIESPSSVTNSESSVRPNKRKRKGTPARHVQSELNDRISETKSNPDNDSNVDTERDSEADNHKANNRKLLEDFERKSEVGLSRPVSQNGEAEGISRPSGRPVHRSTREKYGPPRLDLFGPPQHYLDLFGPPVREPTDNCSVVIRGIGEEEIYCGPGDKDPGDILIPLRSNSHF